MREFELIKKIPNIPLKVGDRVIQTTDKKWYVEKKFPCPGHCNAHAVENNEEFWREII